MTSSAAQQREMLARLHQLAAERELAERQMRSEFETTTVRAQRDLSDARQAAIMRFQIDRDATQREYDSALANAKSQSAEGIGRAEAELRQAAARLHADFSSTQRRAKKEFTEECWEANTVFEATQNAPKVQLEQVEAEIMARSGVVRHALDLANRHLSLCRLDTLKRNPLAADDLLSADVGSDSRDLDDCAASAVAHLEQLKRLKLPKLLIGATPFGMVLVAALTICGATFLIFGHETWTWLFVGLPLSIVAAIVCGVWLYVKSASAVVQPYALLHSDFRESEAAQRAAIDAAKRHCEAENRRIIEHRDQELRAAQQKLEDRMAHATTRRDHSIESANTAHATSKIDLLRRRDEALAEAESTFPRRLDEIQARYQRELHAAQDQFDAGSASAVERRNEAWNRLADQWREGAVEIQTAIAESARHSQKFFPAWDDPAWKAWQPPSAPPPMLSFGQFQVDLRTVPGGISTDHQLNGLIPTAFELPALSPFPQNASLLLKASGEGRGQAIDAVQALMLRMLTSIPPSKLRFTIIDPVGLGENFAGFMHLADHDEQLVTNRIWSEPAHIEQRLADLTEQMENVIQKYLRNEFRSIDEYNAFAGEVAEPFRVLVIANFPVNFTESAARRLTSIVTSGARCGVYTLIVQDTKQPLPPRLDQKDLERNAVTLVWDGQRFVWLDQDYEKYPLQVVTPPPEELFTRLVQNVGREAKAAKRVEVPFEYVAPPRDAWWSGDTASGIRVPLGRAGATKLQYLKLGEGTSQHVLIAGKTGSGKSTLLHALVTNLALTYSPDQVEFYLIDFKKGVEFKTYATHQLPHARVIAIESEREFGLSVIEKLDAELKRRGDLFRQAGVQDVAAYRAAAGRDSMPRLLLIVDEFQELFTDDDKLAQDAALLLDRLVRQGRAFGMHVLLGSQTLGGAYSLARSTIGQMAVRIALQCSEADAHLILSEENSAARLLSRPGEAIYNDANGLVQGNHPFQIVWLSDERREQYLQDLQKMGEEQTPHPPASKRQPPIVFEGNLPADVRRNRPLAELLRAADWPVQSMPVHGWLGEAIAIKDPTAAVFHPQSGHNLLIVGQRAESALGMLATTLLSLAAQHRPMLPGMAGATGFAAGSAAQFYVLEHDRPPDLPLDRALADYRGGLAMFSSVVPHPVQAAGRRDLSAMLAEIAKEIDRRQVQDDHAGPAFYLFISDLGRFRDLRRDESDMGFSFSGSEKPPSPAQLLGNIVRDGPAVGVYTLAWCDSLTAVNRSFDRHLLREFALRVLLQMSANDSSHLIDTPLAGKLGPHVALYYNEEEGRLEKFRPYAWPAADWLSLVQERLNARLPVKKL